MSENFQVVKAPQRSKCNNYFMAAAKEKCKTDVLPENILSIDKEVSSSASSRTGAWFLATLPL